MTNPAAVSAQMHTLHETLLEALRLASDLVQHHPHLAPVILDDLDALRAHLTRLTEHPTPPK